MTEETLTKPERKVKVNFSWAPFWLADWLFSIGFVGLDDFWAMSWIDQFLTLFVTYLLWPLFLGLHLKGVL